jgi:hypothetical protein
LVVEPEVVFSLVFVVETHAVALVSVAAELPPGVVFFVVEPQASVDIAVAFDVLVAVSLYTVEADSAGRPRFLAFPNADYAPSSSSSIEVVGQESVHSAMGVRTNCGLCSIPSNPDLHQNKNLELCCNDASPCHNNLSDTNDRPIDATTSHSRKRGLDQSLEQRKHTCQAALSTPVVREI